MQGVIRCDCVIPKSTSVKYKEFTSPSAKTKTCTACFTNIKEKYKVPKDHTLHLFKGGEKTDQCKVVERYLQTSFTEHNFAVICNHVINLHQVPLTPRKPRLSS